MHEIDERVICSLADKIGIIYSREDFHKLIDNWVFEPTRMLPFHYDLKSSKPVDFWGKITTYSSWNAFGQIALRIVSTGTSEANCKRFLSRQRDVTGLHGANFNCETMDARLQINSSSQIIIG